jgi:hypothetical protein
MGDTKVDEIVQYTLSIVRELRETKRNEKLALTDADTLVARAYEFVGGELKTTQLTAVKVLRYILENPQKAGIKLATPRSKEELDNMRIDLDDTMHKYLVYPYGVEDTSVGGDPDAKALYMLLKNAYDEGRVEVILYARSPLVPGVPREFLGAPKNVYSEGRVTRFGYAIPLAKLVRIFLAGEEESKNEGSGEATVESSSDGEAP